MPELTAVNPYHELFQTTAALAGAFWVASLVVVQVAVDRMGRLDASTPTALPYQPELLFGSLIVAALQFDAMVASLIGLMPPDNNDAHWVATRVLQDIGLLVFVLPMLIFFVDERARRVQLENTVRAWRYPRPTSAPYIVAQILTICALVGGIYVAEDLQFHAKRGDIESLAWDALFFIALGGAATTLAIVMYFLTRPNAEGAPVAVRPAVNISVSPRAEAILDVGALLIGAAGLIFAATYPRLSYGGAHVVKWVVFIASLSAIHSIATTTRIPRGSARLLALLLGAVAFYLNPVFEFHRQQQSDWFWPDVVSALILVVAAGVIAKRVSALGTNNK